MSFLRRLRHRLASSPLRVPLCWLRHRGLRPTDLFLASYPRSGNTWLRFLLCDLLTGQSGGFDWMNAASAELGSQGSAPALLPGDGRLIKTHESFRSEYARAVYLVRDVRDVLLSEHALYLGTGAFDGPIEAFLDRFLEGRVNGFGRWDAHTRSWLDAASERPREILALRYEDLRKTPEEVLSRITEFLGLKSTKESIAAAVANNTLEKLRAKEDQERNTHFKIMNEGQRFIRKGAEGGWRSALTSEQVGRIESVCGPTMKELGYSIGGQPGSDHAPRSE